jgi:HEAT repeat protein
MMRMDKPSDVHFAALAKYLKHHAATVRVHAIRALGAFGADAAAYVPNLVDCLNDQDTTVAGWAILALKAVGSDAKAAVPDLEKLAAGKNATLKSMAEDAIAAITKKTPKAKPAAVVPKNRDAGQ